MVKIPAGRVVRRGLDEGEIMAKPVLPRVHVMVLWDEIEPSAEVDVFDLRGARTHAHYGAGVPVHAPTTVRVLADDRA